MKSIACSRFTTLLLALAVPAFLIVGLFAQTAAAKDEMIVTARKTEEKLRDVPLAVSPFTAENIQELGLKSIDDIAMFTPGFSFTSAFGRQPGSDRPAMRGIATVVNGIANASSVSYFVDGVYLGGSPQSTELSNLERVEILRGPQSAQFGRGTYAGAINYITRKPSDEFEAKIEGSAGEDGYYSGTGWVSGPIVDGLTFYLGAGYDTFDGQYKNQRPQRLGEDIGGEETTNITGKLFWNPTDSLEIGLKLGYQNTDDGHFPIYLQPRTLNNCCFRDPVTAPRAREYYIGDAVPDENGINLVTDLLDLMGGAGTELDRTLASLTIDWELADGYMLSSLTGFVKDEVQTGFDSSYAGYDPIPFGAFKGAFYQFDKDQQHDISQELRLTVTAVENFRFTIGGYYYEGESDEGVSFAIDSDTLQVGNNGLVSGFTLEEIENIAVFGGVDWSIGERWEVGLELRYAEDEITVEERLLPAVLAGMPPIEGCDSRGSMCNDTFESFTPRLTGLFRMTENVNLYANISKGTKPGAFNSDVPDDPMNPGTPDESFRAVDEEEAWNYELGVKSVFWDDRVSLNVAGYFFDVEDQQLTTVIELGPGATTSILQNAGESEVYGIEFESSVQILDEWMAGLTYAYTDAEITERISADEADLMGGDGSFADTQALGSVAGRTSPRIPDHQLSLFTRYERPFGNDNTWYVSADWAYESSKYAQEHNLIETGDRNLVGLRAGFVLGQLELSLWGKNIFDDDTPVDVLRYIDRRFPPNFAPGNGSTSPRGFALTLPRQSQWGVSASYRFGG